MKSYTYETINRTVLLTEQLYMFLDINSIQATTTPNFQLPNNYSHSHLKGIDLFEHRMKQQLIKIFHDAGYRTAGRKY